VIEYVFAFFIAILIGLVASVIGVGGGFLYVPALTFLFGIDQKTAIGTSLTIIVFTSLTGCLSYCRQRRIFYKSALFIIIPSVIFAAIGSYATIFVPGAILSVVFSVFLILVAVNMVVPALPFIFSLKCGPCFDEECRDCFSITASVRAYYLHLFFWGTVAGFNGGITGIGGGVINVPALNALGMPIHFAAATSVLVILATSITGAVVHQRLGQVAIDYAVSFSLGGIIGAYIGANLAPKIRSRHLEFAFSIFLLVMSVAILLETLLSIVK